MLPLSMPAMQEKVLGQNTTKTQTNTGTLNRRPIPIYYITNNNNKG